MARQVAVDDIVFYFTLPGMNYPHYYIRVASRFGSISGPRLQEALQSLVKDGIKVSHKVETPSRFAPDLPAADAQSPSQAG